MTDRRQPYDLQTPEGVDGWAGAGAGLGVSAGVKVVRTAALRALQAGGTVEEATQAARGAAAAAGAAPSAAEAMAQRAVQAAMAALGQAAEVVAGVAEGVAGAVAGTLTHVPVPSSNIDSAAYDPDTQEMEIWFTKYRRLYRYYGVPADGWAAFWAAPSKGFYAKYVMPTLYEYEHVE